MEPSEPHRIYPMPAHDMTSIDPAAEYLVPASADGDAPWKVVRQQAKSELSPPPDGDGVMPPVVTVVFGDGSRRLFNPDDTVDVGWTAP